MSFWNAALLVGWLVLPIFTPSAFAEDTPQFPHEGAWGAPTFTSDVQAVSATMFILSRDSSAKDGWFVQLTEVRRNGPDGDKPAVCTISTYGPCSAQITGEEIVVDWLPGEPTRIAYTLAKDGSLILGKGRLFRFNFTTGAPPNFNLIFWPTEHLKEIWKFAIRAPPFWP